MTPGEIFSGSLFARDFLAESITQSAEWKSISDKELDDLEAELVSIFESFPLQGTPNESQTENDLIWPILAKFGWTESLRQQNLSTRGREDVPDGLLFTDAEAKRRANSLDEEWRRYELGTVLVEAKRWLRPLDGRSQRAGEEAAPSTQILRYLRRVEDLTTGWLRWGILTNGARWRLYYQGAHSVSEDYFEFDFCHLFGLAQYANDRFAVPVERVRRHCLRVIVLFLRRESFAKTGTRPGTFHQRAIDECRYFEAKVAEDISQLVFGSVFPGLAAAIAECAPEAPLDEIREAALILLYRLLFIHYAEDRGLLPVKDRRYRKWAIRLQVREDIGELKDCGEKFSTTSTRYWNYIDDLSRLIDAGDRFLGLPPYDGGLFNQQRVPLLAKVRLCDAALADAIDALSFQRSPRKPRKYINYSKLSVQQLGSIYERLIEHELVRNGPKIEVRPNIFARRASGSYYTSDDLVGLIVDETLGPLVRARLDAFDRAVAEAEARETSAPGKMGDLERWDPAECILKLKVCDPAMGSGHFLVRVVDYLTDRVIAAMADAEAAVHGYTSPLAARIQDIRTTIQMNAKKYGWVTNQAKLDDYHIVRRIVLKRCIYGVDKNPMAVELAKVALWLHTFTVGAPLNFLDHHLRCGDSLFGSWVRSGIDKAKERADPMFFLGEPIQRAAQAQEAIAVIEGVSDAEIAEADRSAATYADVAERTAPLHAFLSLVHAFDWLNVQSREDRDAVNAYFLGACGNPIDIAMGKSQVTPNGPESERLAELLQESFQLVAEERFLHWQVAFPGVWKDWESEELHGGFDAIVGNPPWERMKLQQVEWFASRRPAISMASRAADRKRMIADLEKDGDPLWEDYAAARARAKAAMRMARRGEFPLLGRGDINLYSLFVERSMSLLNPDGVLGLLTPSGIAGDLTAAAFFRSVSSEGRLRALYDFENRRMDYGLPPFFPDVHRSFKFCVFVASKSRPPVSFEAVGGALPPEAPARCAFFLQGVEGIRDPDRWFPMAANQFARINPNTGTAPILRSRGAAELTDSIYKRAPVLVDRSGADVARAWPVTYRRMFDMTNDSKLFRTRRELEEREGAWPAENNRYGSAKGEWVPLYEGKMVQAYDHRAASIVVNPDNQHRPALPCAATLEQHRDPSWLPRPRYWVLASTANGEDERFSLVFKAVTSPTNMRSLIAALVPRSGRGNSLPDILIDGNTASDAALLLANLNAILFDFVARQKIQGQNLNWFVVEQLPVVPPTDYDSMRFGRKTAGEIVREAVLELTYTAHDMAPFAREMDYLDPAGDVQPPFPWSADRRLSLQAKLDAAYFLLYGVTDRADVRFVYSMFPSVEAKEINAYGTFRSQDLCLAYMNALEAGEASITLPV